MLRTCQRDIRRRFLTARYRDLSKVNWLLRCQYRPIIILAPLGILLMNYNGCNKAL